MKISSNQAKTILLKQNISLLGKQILKPIDLSCMEIKSLLWTAFDLKKLYTANYSYTNTLQNKDVTLLMSKPSIVMQTLAAKACNLLQVKLNVVVADTWDKKSFVSDFGKFFTLHTDLLLCRTKYQFKLEELGSNAKIPIMVLQNSKFNMLQALSNVMTIQEHYGHLNHLNLAHVGATCPTINTTLCIGPRLGLNIRYYCACVSGCRMSPAQLPVAKKACVETETELKECSSIEEAVNKAHIIIASVPKELNVEHMKVKVEHLKIADANWSFFHCVPRKHKVFEDIDERRNLVWRSSKNSVYLLAAVILRLLQKHDNVTEKPDFEKLKSPTK